ncbi:biosynthetic-type acetolactate synthase large subunit [Litoreibacter sp.]|nr:biosynthetic-type acetolactate synthase large subunit [Litoreibacter sp.]
MNIRPEIQTDTTFPTVASEELSTGAQVIVQTLINLGVETIFGYPGGAVLPIYDEIFSQGQIEHILVRHEQAAVHAAEGYARSTGKPGVVLVTSGPGVTNTVTGLADAMMDSVPVVVLCGQVPTFMIGTDAFQEADAMGITRPCTKHNWQITALNHVESTIWEAFDVATTGRPGPVLIEIPKDVQVGTVSTRIKPARSTRKSTVGGISLDMVEPLVRAIETAKRPVFYTGGGVINSGPAASSHLGQLVEMTGFPITSTLMGLGAYPGSGKNWLGMLGLHGLYEANMAVHDCDLLINIGARFDDRVTGEIASFAPHAQKVHIDIDPSSINKIIRTDIPIIGDVAKVLAAVLNVWKAGGAKTNASAVSDWWERISAWKRLNCLGFDQQGPTIKPQFALSRLEALSCKTDRYICTEVGQHQMWAAQYITFDAPNRWMTSGGLGTMGYGFPASIGVQMAHPDSLVINVAGEASWMMNMQELGTAVQYGLPVKQFILNNSRLGMVDQLQQMSKGYRFDASWSASLPDFVKFAEAYGVKGIRCDDPDLLDAAIIEMLEHDGPVVFDCRVDKDEQVFPMIKPGKPHNEMLLTHAQSS